MHGKILSSWEPVIAIKEAPKLPKLWEQELPPCVLFPSHFYTGRGTCSSVNLFKGVTPCPYNPGQYSQEQPHSGTKQRLLDSAIASHVVQRAIRVVSIMFSEGISAAFASPCPLCQQDLMKLQLFPFLCLSPAPAEVVAFLPCPKTSQAKAKPRASL